MTSTRRGTLNLAIMMQPLPPAKLPNGKEIPMVHFTAEAYDLWNEVQDAISDEQAGRPVDVPAFRGNLDRLLALCLPEATPDDLATFGARTEAKLAVAMACAGKLDQVIASLQELEGNATAGQSTPHSDPGTTSAPRSSRTRGGSVKAGRKRIGG